ncbi:hypothetical protein EVC20_162 [Rhizobium phage RHph_Y2_17_1]|nr:hypothetical protein EVC19_162 [Rhizobium phage RHph_Y2_11]QIG75901.1 hypothetical protein EVC20_162 [Rhizobium phage RHph_Y2_17_1]
MPQGGRYIECDRCRKNHFSLNLPWSRDGETITAARAAGWRVVHEPEVNFSEDVCPDCLTLEDARPKGEPVASSNSVGPVEFLQAIAKIAEVVIPDPRSRR